MWSCTSQLGYIYYRFSTLNLSHNRLFPLLWWGGELNPLKSTFQMLFFWWFSDYNGSEEDNCQKEKRKKNHQLLFQLSTNQYLKQMKNYNGINRKKSEVSFGSLWITEWVFHYQKSSLTHLQNWFYYGSLRNFFLNKTYLKCSLRM